MPEPQRGPQTLYAAVILAALVAVIVVARRWQSEPTSPSQRAAPQLAVTRPNHPREPRPLVISEGVPLVPSRTTGIRGEVPAGFPADESDDVGPITQNEA